MNMLDYLQMGSTPQALAALGNNMKLWQDASLNTASGMKFTDAAVSSGLAFLVSELEKLDPKLRGPLTSITWPRDMPVKRGGGWVDFTSVQFVDYANSGPNQYGLSGNVTTQIPVVSANVSKDIYRVFNWQNVMKVNFIDMQKAQTVGRSLEEMLDKGIRLNWDKSIDWMTYQGWTGYPGLVNNSNIAAAAVANPGSGTTWAVKTPAQILTDINAALVSTWAASEYDVTGMATHILIPPTQFAQISTQTVSTAGNVSILTYVLENNIAKSQGVELKIFPSRWCIGAGSGPTDRMVSYVNDEDRIYADITVPIGRVMTQPTVSDGGAYLTLYSGQLGVVKFLYPQTAVYSDGI